VKAARQRALADLLRDQDVTSQAQLRELLRQQGFEATQATVSRDLEDLGAFKVRGAGGQLVYALPERDGSAIDEEDLRRALGYSLLSAAPSRNLIVVRTPSGHAQALASALDQSGLPGLLGTVAGDDTVLVVCDERTASRTLTRRLLALAEPRSGLAPLRPAAPPAARAGRPSRGDAPDPAARRPAAGRRRRPGAAAG
jgi:transcriptional regulator of arginine metabolism